MPGIQAGQAYVELVPKLDAGFAAKTAAAVEKATSPVLDRVAAKFASAGERLRGIGTKMSAFVTLPLVGAGVAAFNFASDLNESLSKARVVFGVFSPAIENFAKTAATNLGISRQEALESTGTFGNLFRAMGLGVDKAAGLSQGVVTLASDLASFNNADPTDVLEALRAGLVGEVEPLRRFGINLSAARVEQEATRLGLQKVNGEFTAGAKAQAAYSLILADTKTAQGDFARTSSGAANTQRILTARFKDLAAEVGTKLLPIGTKLLGFVSGLFDRFERLSPSIKRIILIVVGLVAAAGPLAYILGAIATVVGFLISPIGIVIAVVAALAGAFYLAYTKLAPFRDFVDNTLVPALRGIGEAVVGFVTKTDFGAWVDAIAGAVGRVVAVIRAGIGIARRVFRTILNELEPIIAGVSRFADRIGDRLDGIVAAFRNIFRIIAFVVGAYIAVLIKLWQLAGDDILHYVRAAWDAIKSVIQAALDIIIGIVDIFIGIFTLDFGRVWQGLTEVVGGAFRAIAAIVVFGWETIKAIIGAALSIVGAIFSTAWNFLVSIVSGAIEAIVGFVLNLGARIIGPFVAVWGAIVNAAGTAIGAILGFFASLPDKILSFVGSVLNAAVSIGSAIINGIGQGLSAVGGFLGDLYGAVTQAIGRAVRFMVHLIDNAIPNSIDLGIIDINIPDNPIGDLLGFKDGGVVPGPRGAPTLALVHGGEAIFNPGQLKALAGAGITGRGSVTYAPTLILPDGSRRTIREFEAASLRSFKAALRAEAS